MKVLAVIITLYFLAWGAGILTPHVHAFNIDRMMPCSFALPYTDLPSPGLCTGGGASQVLDRYSEATGGIRGSSGSRAQSSAGVSSAAGRPSEDPPISGQGIDPER